MTKGELLALVDRSFGNLSRPGMFIRGTCSCDECLEHEQTMQSFSLPELPLEKLENPGWDPNGRGRLFPRKGTTRKYYIESGQAGPSGAEPRLPLEYRRESLEK